ncbi:hypothetical protein [Polaromonas sp.]|uniref:hypothetical protein n=1 Tax=Polaromonas sp. TaxID=1869339 RepID=UPI003563E461
MQTQLQQVSVANRAQRRQAKRATRKVHAFARRPKPIMANAIEVVTLRATRLTDTERGQVLQGAQAAFKALREGVATQEQWVHLSDLVCAANAIETQGVVRGIHEHLAAAGNALDAVWRRVQAGARGSDWGRCTTLYFDEIGALDTALFLHDHQLQQLAVSEYHAALRTAKRDPRATAATATMAADSLPVPVQENLL